MEVLNLNLAAGGVAQLRKAGAYIEILSSTGPVNITLWTMQGGTKSSIKGGLSGLYLNADFGAFDVTDASGAGNTVQLLVCDAGEDGGSRRQPGNVSVTNTITSGVQFVSGNGLLPVMAVTSTAVVTPAQNVNGVTVRGSSVSATQQAGGQSWAYLIAAPTAPTTLTPANSYPIAGVNPSGAQYLVDSRNDTNYQIPAGWGIYLVQQNTGQAATQANYNLVFEKL